MSENENPSPEQETNATGATPEAPQADVQAPPVTATGTGETQGESPAPVAAKTERPPKKEPPPPPRTAPRHSAFSGLAKFLTEEQRNKLAQAPEEPTVTVETRGDRGDRGDRDRGPRSNKPAYGAKPGGRRDGAPSGPRREGTHFKPAAPSAPGGNRERPSSDRRPAGPRGDGRDNRGGPRTSAGRDDRSRRPEAPPAPKLESVIIAAEKTGLQEASFAQGLIQGLEAEFARFSTALGAIDALDAGLRETTLAEAQKLLDFAKKPLQRTVDGQSPLIIGVVGGPGVGKTTLIEALAGDAKAEVTRDEKGNAATVWRGIRFVEQPGEHNADGLVEIRMADVPNQGQGRPLLVIENVKVNLHDGFAFDRFVKDPDDFLGPIPRYEDDETAPRVHLPAFSLATRPEHKTRAQRLREISRFDLVERALAKRLHSRAKLLRIQRFLDDVIESILPLRDYALTVNLQSHLEGKAWQGRLAEMTSDITKWGDVMRASIKENAALPFVSLRGQLEAFANKHAGDRHIEDLWTKRIAGLQQSLTKHIEEELKRLEANYKSTAGEIIERSKATRQPGEGPLPQPVLMSVVPTEFREATATFRAKLGEVIDPVHWVSFPQPWEPAIDTTAMFAEDKDKLFATLSKRVDKIERHMAQDLETRFVGGVLAPVEKKLTTESRSLLDALFNLGREGHTMLGVVNEVLLSLVQRLIERAAESHSIRLPLIQKIVREPGHRTKLLVPPSRDLFPLARRLQEALGERVDLISAVDSVEARIAHALMPAKIKPDMIKINEEKRMAQVRIPRGESGKAFGRNGANQRLAAALVGYHLHLRIAKDNVPETTEKEKEKEKEVKSARPARKPRGPRKAAAAKKPAEAETPIAAPETVPTVETPATPKDEQKPE